jgi:hypothetical protein
MKVILTETQLRVLLKEEFSEKVITQLVDKFMSSNPYAYRDKIKDYVKIFDKIKNGPNIINKDITTYSLPELEEVIINYIKNQKPKSYTGAKKPFKKSNAKATPKIQVVEKVQFKNGKNK